MSELSRRRKKARNRNRRILREHRVRRPYVHSIKILDLGDGASIWGYWGCPRCPGTLDNLPGNVNAKNYGEEDKE